MKTLSTTRRSLPSALRIIGATLVAILWLGCSDPTAPDGEPAYSGQVEQVTPTSDLSGAVIAHILIRADDDVCGIVFTVAQGTQLLVDGKVASIGKVEVGRTADVWFDGVVATSCPAQAGADLIRVR